MMTDACWRVLLLGLILVWWTWAWCRRWRRQSRTASAQLTRLLKPRTPDACPLCRQQAATAPALLSPRPPVPPWSTIKSRRGAPKRIDTQGFACPNRSCPYYHITDAQIHALVADGAHGRCERIQTFRCQACGVTFSARRNTPHLSAQNRVSPHCGSAQRARGRALDRGRGARVRASACHHHHLAHTGW